MLFLSIAKSIEQEDCIPLLGEEPQGGGWDMAFSKGKQASSLPVEKRKAPETDLNLKNRPSIDVPTVNRTV